MSDYFPATQSPATQPRDVRHVQRPRKQRGFGYVSPTASGPRMFRVT